mgnify:CR=1 FL=1
MCLKNYKGKFFSRYWRRNYDHTQKLLTHSKINSQKVVDSLLPRKDVDGFHSLNYGRMARGLPAHVPATPLGILRLLEHYGVETAGKHCVIVGRGNTVGAPLSILMGSNRSSGNATVTVCHKHSKNINML